MSAPCLPCLLCCVRRVTCKHVVEMQVASKSKHTKEEAAGERCRRHKIKQTAGREGRMQMEGPRGGTKKVLIRANQR